jgi:predicted glycosyltransferase
MTPITKFLSANEDGRHKRRVLIHCQYVFGIGHFVRTVELARSLSKHFEVSVVNGGEAVPNYDLPFGVDWIQMPAIYKEEAAEELRSVDPIKSLECCFAERDVILECAVRRIMPDVLITEHFPFGLLFEPEVIRLIERVKICNPHSKIVSSVRDVIESKNGGMHDDHICRLLNRYYDLVMVHGDENIVPFPSSFPKFSHIQVPVLHTGYVVQKIGQKPQKLDIPMVVASVGGGRLGGEMLDSILKSHRSIFEHWEHSLMLFVGAFQQIKNDLRAYADENSLTSVTILDFDRLRYQDALASASLAICMGGYNSVIEAVSAELPVLIYQRKFYGNNQEQECRIQLFQKAGFVESFGPDELAPESISARVLGVLPKKRPTSHEIRMNGAEESCNMITSLFGNA